MMAEDVWDTLVIQDDADGCIVGVKVVPGASRTKIMGVLNGSLKVAISSPPEAGKANAELIKYLAKAFKLKRCEVAIVAGHTQPRKRLRFAESDATDFRDRLRNVQ